MNKQKLLILIVAYNARSTISQVLTRIPGSLSEEYFIEVLVLDDASTDTTFERTYETKNSGNLPFKLTILANPVNQGYGGNQKLGYHYAVKNGYDYVALLHADGQYSPEMLPELLRPLHNGTCEAVFGSRMVKNSSALIGGMPLYKFLGNRILTFFENFMLRAKLSEYHSGYRVYAVAALKKIPWDLNTNDFHFDTEIIIQLMLAEMRIIELPIPTYYGDEICYVNGLKYAWNVAMSVIKVRFQELGLLYDRKYDCKPEHIENQKYQPKLNFLSSHKICINKIEKNTTVLDFGCTGGYLSSVLKNNYNCTVTGIDRYPLKHDSNVDHFILHNLDDGLPEVSFDNFDYVLLLDIIEHLSSPEEFVDSLREVMANSPAIKIFVSVPNIGFFIVRFALLIGQFNYGKRGILDFTHKRLFSFRSLRRLFEQRGFRILETIGIPPPYQLALGNNNFSTLLLWVNKVLIKISKGLFSYQIFLVVTPLPSLCYLIKKTQEYSSIRIRSKKSDDK